MTIQDVGQRPRTRRREKSFNLFLYFVLAFGSYASWSTKCMWQVWSVDRSKNARFSKRVPIGLSVFAGLMAVANRQTDSAADRIDVVHAMRPNNDKFQFFNRRFQLRTNSRRYVVHGNHVRDATCWLSEPSARLPTAENQIRTGIDTQPTGTRANQIPLTVPTGNWLQSGSE